MPSPYIAPLEVPSGVWLSTSSYPISLAPQGSLLFSGEHRINCISLLILSNPIKFGILQDLIFETPRGIQALVILCQKWPTGGDSSSNEALGIGHLKWQGMGWLHGKSYCPPGLHSNRLAIQHKIIEMRAPLRKAIVLILKLRSKRSGGIKFAVVVEQWLPY